MNRWICSALCVGLAVMPVMAASGERVTDPNGEVTLGWEQFNRMWDKLQSLEKQVQTMTDDRANPPPPVPFAVARATYKGEVGSRQVLMEGVIELEVFERKNWVKVPVLPSALAVTDARLDGKPVSLLDEDGSYQLVLRGAGRHLLRVNFPLKAPKAEEAPALNFPVPRTPMTVLALNFPQPRLDVTISPAQSEDVRTIDGHTQITAAIPPTSAIGVRWQAAVPETVEGPAKTYLDTAGLMTVSEGAVRGLWTLHYSVLHRGIRALRMKVPADWNILSVTGDGVQEWKVQADKDQAVLVAQLAFLKKGDFDIVVQGETGLGDKDTVLAIPHLEPLDVEREQGTLAVEVRGPIDVQVQESQGLNLIDPKELPPLLWQEAAQPILFAFRYTRPHQLALALRRHPEAPMLTTVIDDANAVTVYSARGPALTKVRYQVRNHLKQYLTLALPEHAELWTAFVSEQPVKPMKLDDGRYRIPLAKSALEAQGDEGFPVEITYYLPKSRFYPLARKAAIFPIPDAPVSRLLWSVYLPERYRVAYFGGDLEKGDNASGLSPILGVRTVPLNGLREKKNEGLRDDVSRLAYAVYGAGKAQLAAPVDGPDDARAPASRQMALLDSLEKDKVSAHVAGALPVAFEIPTTGQLFHFAQTMVVDEQPELTFVYVHRGLVQAVELVLLGLMASVAYRRRREMLASPLWKHWNRLSALCASKVRAYTRSPSA